MFTILVTGRSQFYTQSFAKATVLVGRALDSDIVLPDLTVSRHHCLIHVEPQDFSVEDRDSTNGCYVDRLLVKGRVSVRPHREIQIGTYALFLQHGHGNVASYLGQASQMVSDYSENLTAQVMTAVRNPSAITQPNPVYSPPELPFLPSRASVRKLLDRVLVSDSELDAFCLDHFPLIRAKFAGNMDRVSKVSLLLERAELGEILRLLREDHPDAA